MAKTCDSEGMMESGTFRWGDSLGGPNHITWVFERREPLPTVVREKGVAMVSESQRGHVAGFEDGRRGP